MRKKAEKQSVLVTGGAGFIGSHVVDALLSRGLEVHVVDDLSTGSRKNLDKKAKLHVMDVQAKGLQTIFKKVAPTSVVHLAAQIDVRKSFGMPIADAMVNIAGGLNVLMCALESGARHFTFASTAAVYSNLKTIPVPESVTPAPLSPYGVSKLAFEHYLHTYHHANGLHCAILRFANVYGPRQTPKGEAGAVAIFMNRILDGEPAVINGSGEQTRDYVYVGDVARMVAEASSRALHGTFNVSTGKETSVNDLYEKVRAALGSRAKAEHGPAKPNDDPRCALDPSKAAAVAGWRAEVGLDDGLKRTCEWLRASRRR